jgi:alpha-glucosidase
MPPLQFGWQYTLIDANWNKWNNNNAEPLIKELVAYARERNVGIWLWYNSGGPTNTVTEEPRDAMSERETRRREFARLQKLGIKGVKIDFWQSDKQSMLQQYLDTLSLTPPTTS